MHWNVAHAPVYRSKLLTRWAVLARVRYSPLRTSLQFTFIWFFNSFVVHIFCLLLACVVFHVAEQSKWFLEFFRIIHTFHHVSIKLWIIFFSFRFVSVLSLLSMSWSKTRLCFSETCFISSVSDTNNCVYCLHVSTNLPCLVFLCFSVVTFHLHL